MEILDVGVLGHGLETLCQHCGTNLVKRRKQLGQGQHDERKGHGAAELLDTMPSATTGASRETLPGRQARDLRQGRLQACPRSRQHAG